MNSYLIISPDSETRKSEVINILKSYNLPSLHPDVHWYEDDKIGIETTRDIKELLSKKPYQAQFQAVVIKNADCLSTEGQNSLLKILEEPPGNALILLCATSQDMLTDTVISRCQVINLPAQLIDWQLNEEDTYSIQQLLQLPIEDRLQKIEKLENRDRLIGQLAAYYHQKLNTSSIKQFPTLTETLETIVISLRWLKQNVNSRAILEYLMLKIPVQSK